jgi:hypothetical protein
VVSLQKHRKNEAISTQYGKGELFSRKLHLSELFIRSGKTISSLCILIKTQPDFDKMLTPPHHLHAKSSCKCERG